MGFGVLLPAVVGGGLASAQPSARVDLRWEAPPGCPDAPYVVAAVARLLESAPPTSTQVRADAVVTLQADGAWALALTTTREGTISHRTLQADSCAAVADATALILALAIDPAHAAVPAPPAVTGAEPAPATAPPVASAVVAATPALAAPPARGPALPAAPVASSAPAPNASSPAATPTRPRALRFAVAASFDFDLGSLPAPAYGVEGGVAFVVSRVRLEALAAYWPVQRAQASLTGGTSGLGSVTADVRLVDGGARGCFALPPAGAQRRLRFEPCLGLEVGSLRGEGESLGTSTPASALWLAARADLRFRIRLFENIALAGSLGVAIPLVRDPFVVQGPAGPVSIFEPSAVAARGSVGPEVSF